MNFRHLIIILFLIILSLSFFIISTNLKSNKKEINIYHLNSHNFMLVPVSKPIEKPVTPKKILEALIKSENKGELENLIPKETKILSLEEKKNILIVNLSKEFENFNNGYKNSKLQLMSLVNTIIKSTKFKYVKILIEGQEKYLLNKKVYIKDPIQKDEFLIK